MLRRTLGAVPAILAVLALCAGGAGVLWLSHTQRTDEMLAAREAAESPAPLPAGLRTQAPEGMAMLRRLGDAPPAGKSIAPVAPPSESVGLDTPAPATPVCAPVTVPVTDCVPLSGESESRGGAWSASLPEEPDGRPSEGTG